MKLASNGTQSTILRILRDHPNASRSSIAERSTLPLPAVSRAVAQLIAKDVVVETPLADTSGPRRKRGICLNPRVGHCLSIEYGPSFIEGVVVDTAYNTVVSRRVDRAMDRSSRDEKVRDIVSFVEDLQAQVPASGGPCLALAVVDPGVIERESGTVIMSSILDNWVNVPIVRLLQEHFRVPVMLLSTSMALTRAVDRLELKSTVKDLIYVEYGAGIGCGLKLDDHYVSGQSDLAGELGHTMVTTENIPCRCGSTGCLEAMAALPALARNAAQAIRQGSQGVLAAETDLDGHQVLAAAARGDRLATRIVDEAYQYLGRAVGGLINILAPQKVLFSAVLATAGPEAVSFLLQTTRRSVLPSHLDRVELRISSLDEHVGALGGAVAVLDHSLQA